PNDQPASCDDWYACAKLARYLTELHKKEGVRTIAFVHDEVTRHSVLPVLACSEVVISSKPIGTGQRQRLPGIGLGVEAMKDGKPATDYKPLHEDERLSYQNVAAGRFAPVLVHKMHDKSIQVVKLRAPAAGQDRYQDAREKNLPTSDPVPGLDAGN